MQIVSTVRELRRALHQAPRPVGLVPTMGYLHNGHASLVHQARRENAFVAVSIFVNPTQFGPNDDLSRYPRDLPRDLKLLEGAGADLVFTPVPEEVYPKNFDTWVSVDKLAQKLEGASRPGHFRGVCTVVLKLFNQFRPDRAYFGQKDAQQVAVIRQMAEDLDTDIEIVVCPTMREPDGLAMSSRNVYLNAQERKAASVLYQSLSRARDLFQKGERDAETLRSAMYAILGNQPSAKVQYVSVADSGTLDELQQISGPVLVSMAVFVGKTRLIDNIVLP